MKRKLHIVGGNFLRKWQGQPPQGRSMSPADEHKGQAREPMMNRAVVVYDSTQKAMIRTWSF